jgi:hypothetical protein
MWSRAVLARSAREKIKTANEIKIIEVDEISWKRFDIGIAYLREMYCGFKL